MTVQSPNFSGFLQREILTLRQFILENIGAQLYHGTHTLDVVFTEVPEYVSICTYCMNHCGVGFSILVQSKEMEPPNWQKQAGARYIAQVPQYLEGFDWNCERMRDLLEVQSIMEL